MAGDWIPMRVDLLDDPAVIAIAVAVGIDEYAVAGRLLKLWSWANRHLRDGHACVPDKWVDDYLDTAGFAAAMLDAGWLRTRSGGGLEFTSFDRWNSNGAKVRLGETLRKRAFREKKSAAKGVPKVSGTNAGHRPGPEKRREEKRREKEEPPNPPADGGERKSKPPPFDPLAADLPHQSLAFASAWAEWVQHRREKREPLTPTTVRKQLRDLGGLTESNAVACIERSIANGYTGLFPDNHRGQPAKPPTTAKPADDFWERKKAEAAAARAAQEGNADGT